VKRFDSNKMLRVDQAGEYGAARIYAGQLAVLGNRHPIAREIGHMATQEKRHLDHFNGMMVDRGVAPTVLQPIWHVAGYALGAATAIMGPRAAMACTAAIETEIDRHYSAQLEQLGDSDPPLSAAIADFQADEIEHKEAALASGAEEMPGYGLLSMAIRIGCRAAIRFSERV
jgi:3-demethoxyubiquinol 3-hydroxylase